MENGVVKRQGMDLTQGNTAWSLVMFSLPMIAGNFLQQLYNVADTIILGQLAGSTALAAAGSSFSLMNFVTSIFLGLCLGTGVQLSMDHARRDPARLKTDLWHSFVVTALPALAIWLGMTLFRDTILLLLQIPAEVVPDMRAYLGWITAGIPAVYLFNFFGGFFRAVGDSRTPAVWLIVTCILNIVLDFSLENCRRGTGDDDGAVDQRGGDHRDVLAPVFLSVCRIAGFPLGCTDCKTGNVPGTDDISAAVCDEFRDPAGAGKGEYLWSAGDGRVRGWGQNRQLRIYAGAGIRKCGIHVHCPESWGGKSTAGQVRYPHGGCHQLRVLSVCISAGSAFPPVVAGMFHSPGSGSAGGGKPVSGGGRQFLFCNRDPVSAVRVFPGVWKHQDQPAVDAGFSGNPGTAFLDASGCRIRAGGHLVVCPHRLAAGRCAWDLASHPPGAEQGQAQPHQQETLQSCQ